MHAEGKYLTILSQMVWNMQTAYFTVSEWSMFKYIFETIYNIKINFRLTFIEQA